MTTEPNVPFYSIADAEAQRTYVGVRRAAQWVGFFLPHLRVGDAVLDCGCGVGSITLDIAEYVAPGQVIGIDVDASQLALARASATERGLSNVAFEQADIYTLPFADASFDAVLAHTLLVHLRDRARALQEMHRVLTTTGVVGVADDDFGTLIYSPDHPLMQQGFALWLKVLQYNGGDPFYARHLRSVLLQAGFVRTEGYAVAADHYGTLDETRRYARLGQRLLRTPEIANLMINQGWTTQAELDAIAEWFGQWGERPDAFASVAYCAAVGWKS